MLRGQALLDYIFGEYRKTARKIPVLLKKAGMVLLATDWCQSVKPPGVKPCRASVRILRHQTFCLQDFLSKPEK